MGIVDGNNVSGTVLATDADISIEVGYVPSLVKLTNLENGIITNFVPTAGTDVTPIEEGRAGLVVDHDKVDGKANVTITDGTDATITALIAGELETALKTADSATNVTFSTPGNDMPALIVGELATAKGSAVVDGDVFTVNDEIDTADDALEGEKGGVIVDGDKFLIIDASAATFAFICNILAVTGDQFSVNGAGDSTGYG